MPIPAAKIMDRFFLCVCFLVSFDYIPVQDKRSFDPSGLLPDGYSVCFRIMFPLKFDSFLTVRIELWSSIVCKTVSFHIRGFVEH